MFRVRDLTCFMRSTVRNGEYGRPPLMRYLISSWLIHGSSKVLPLKCRTCVASCNCSHRIGRLLVSPVSTGPSYHCTVFAGSFSHRVDQPIMPGCCSMVLMLWFWPHRPYPQTRAGLV